MHAKLIDSTGSFVAVTLLAISFLVAPVEVALASETSVRRDWSTQSVRNYPGDIATRRKTAHELYQSMHFAESTGVFKQIVETSGNDATDQYWLGEALLHSGQYKEASKAFETALSLDPHMDKIYPDLVSAYIAVHDWTSAQATCRNGLSNAKDAYVLARLRTVSKLADLGDKLLSGTKLAGSSKPLGRSKLDWQER